MLTAGNPLYKIIIFDARIGQDSSGQNLAQIFDSTMVNLILIILVIIVNNNFDQNKMQTKFLDLLLVVLRA